MRRTITLSLLMLLGTTAAVSAADAKKASQTPTIDKACQKDKRLGLQKDGQLVLRMELAEKKDQKGTSEIVCGLTEKAVSDGMKAMKLVGKITEQNLPNRNRKVEVIWDKATYNNKEVSLEKPFSSKFEIRPKQKFSVPDNFRVMGDAEVLAEAWKKLKKGEKTQKKEQSVSTSQQQSGGQNTNSRTSTTGFSTGGGGTNYSTTPPVKTNYVIDNSDGNSTIKTETCGLRVDSAQGKVIIQQQVYVNGKVQGGCEDSSNSIPITKEYSTCEITNINGSIYRQYTTGYVDPDTNKRIIVEKCKPDMEQAEEITKNYDVCVPLIDNATGFVHRQYVLQYIDPSSGKPVEIQSCTPDMSPGSTYPMTTTVEGCSIRHDFETGKSYQQTKKTYTINGTVHTAEPCTDSNQVYNHHTTTETCNVQQDGDTIIASERKYIEIDGAKQYITECTPLDSSVMIESEPCETQKYTHNFEAGQSFLNKNYYYMASGQRIDLASCIPSETAFVHQKDSSVCPASHNDANRTTLLMAKTYIEDDGEKSYIKNCETFGSPLPYIQADETWKKASYFPNQTLSVNQELWDQVQIGIYNGVQITDGQGTPVTDWQYDSNSREIISPTGVRSDQVIQGWISIFHGKHYCFSHGLQDLGTFNGLTLDIENSDERPTYESTSFDKIDYTCWTDPEKLGPLLCPANLPPVYLGYAQTQYKCSIPKCNLTVLHKYPTWMRGDSSLYQDTSTILDQKVVCGTGSKVLNGGQ